MMKSLAALLTVLALVAFAAANTNSLDRTAELTVHEWGTFTTVAGVEGTPVDWLPLGGPADLPCFVNRFNGGKGSPSLLTYEQARTRLKGTVRMETPVLYFYSPREQSVNVRVDFPGGLVTEWYPQASVQQVAVRERSLVDNIVGSRIEWRDVKILPGHEPTLPLEKRSSHYYLARETDAAPVQVRGKDEKFLFYRGVGSFPVPLTARVTSQGKIAIGNTGNDIIPALVLFENQGGKLGYRVHRNLKQMITLERPALTADFASLQRDLETFLTAEGLFAKEAHAMVETWRDSWFEEGTRIFYIVPQRAVDEILPLSIEPKPRAANVARAFVGRMELITPAIIDEVAQAIAKWDMATLAKHGRFLGPIAERISGNTTAIQPLLDAAYRSFLGDISAGCN